MAAAGSRLTLALLLSLAPAVAPAGTYCAERDDWVTCLCEKWARDHERLYPGADTQVCGQLFNVTEVAKEFGSWLKQFAKVYADSKQESERFVNFAYNVVFMRFINSSATNYSLAPNEFSDLTPEEFKKQREIHLQQAAPGNVLGSFHGAADFLPESHDWVEEGLISDPRHQGNTQSCWAFAVASTLEGGWAKRTGVLVELSPQQFVDCTGSWLSASYGGDLHTPVENVATEHDLCSARSYRYTGRDGTCKQEDPDVCVTQIPRGAVVGYRWAHRSERGLMQALYLNGPVSLGIDGLSEQMMSYNSGVITFPCDGQPNHAVSAVGYGTHGSLPYWKIKNSWGTQWGEHGFFRLLRGYGGVNGHCSIFVLSPMIPVFTDDPELLGQAGSLQQDNDKIFGVSSGQSGFDQESLERLARSTAVPVAGGLLALFCTCCCWVCCCKNKKAKSRGLLCLADDDESDDEEEDDSEDEETGDAQG